MCSVTAAIVTGILGAGATVYSAQKQADAQEQAAKMQLQAAKETATATPTASSQTSTDVTAAVQANRRRVAAAQGLGSTITGAGSMYQGNVGGSKSLLGS